MFLLIIRSKDLDVLHKKFQEWTTATPKAYIVSFDLKTEYFVKDKQDKYNSSWIDYTLFIYYDNLSEGETQEKELKVISTPSHVEKHENDVNDFLTNAKHADCSEILISSDTCFRPNKKKTGTTDPYISYCTAIIHLH